MSRLVGPSPTIPSDGSATTDAAERRAARSRHPSSIWVPDVERLARRLRSRSAGRNIGADVTPVAYQEGT